MENLDWKSLPEGREKYSAYLASREWAVLKERVKKRSGDQCERCFVAEGTQTHHQTYIRKYNEQLEDLLHVCAPCHEFLSGKTDIDPALQRPLLLDNYHGFGEWSTKAESVYLAGKITGTAWRDEIVPNWSRGDVGSCNQGRYWETKEDIVQAGSRRIDMTGPWWFDASGFGNHGTIDFNTEPHASGHFGKHGLELHKPFVFLMAKFAIKDADFIFAWIDTTDCHGTLVEIGIAVGLEKPVYAYTPREQIRDELWFAFQPTSNNGRIDQIQPNAGEAWRHFLKTHTK